MPYGLLADAVVVVHLAFILFVSFGALLALRWRSVPWYHIPAVLWGGLVEVTGWICPLTPLENWLRLAGGAAGYRGGFVEHYLLPIVYPSALTLRARLVLAGGLIVLNAGIYVQVWRTRNRGEEADPVAGRARR